MYISENGNNWYVRSGNFEDQNVYIRKWQQLICQKWRFWGSECIYLKMATIDMSEVAILRFRIYISENSSNWYVRSGNFLRFRIYISENSNNWYVRSGNLRIRSKEWSYNCEYTPLDWNFGSRNHLSEQLQTTSLVLHTEQWNGLCCSRCKLLWLTLQNLLPDSESYLLLCQWSSSGDWYHAVLLWSVTEGATSCHGLVYVARNRYLLPTWHTYAMGLKWWLPMNPYAIPFKYLDHGSQ